MGTVEHNQALIAEQFHSLYHFRSPLARQCDARSHHIPLTLLQKHANEDRNKY